MIQALKQFVWDIRTALADLLLTVSEVLVMWREDEDEDGI